LSFILFNLRVELLSIETKLRPIGIDNQSLRFDQDILAGNFWMLDF
jgi:hypothetical protein